VKDRATAPLNNNTRGLQQPHTSAAWSKPQTMTPTREKSEKQGKLGKKWPKPQGNTNPTVKRNPRGKRTLDRDIGNQEMTPEVHYGHHRNNSYVGKITVIPGFKQEGKYGHHNHAQNPKPILNANTAFGSNLVSPQVIMSEDVMTVSDNNHVKVDINDGEPPTNQTQSGKLPQKIIGNMVSNKKQQANEKAAAAKAAKAKAKAAAAKAAEKGGIEGNQNQDLPMHDGNQGDITPSESVGSKRKAITPQENIDDEGIQISITHMGIVFKQYFYSSITYF
jgi:hypothetical protein